MDINQIIRKHSIACPAGLAWNIPKRLQDKYKGAGLGAIEFDKNGEITNIFYTERKHDVAIHPKTGAVRVPVMMSCYQAVKV